MNSDRFNVERRARRRIELVLNSLQHCSCPVRNRRKLTSITSITIRQFFKLHGDLCQVSISHKATLKLAFHVHSLCSLDLWNSDRWVYKKYILVFEIRNGNEVILFRDFFI